MRRSVLIAIAFCLIGTSVTTALGADRWPRLWPRGDEASAAPEVRRSASPVSWLAPPRVWLPSLELKPLWSAGDSRQRDWSTPITAGWDSLQVGATKLRRGVQHGGAKVWQTTRKAFARPLLPIGAGPPQPSMWQRLFAPSHHDGPQTVQEFLSQRRP